MLIIELKLITSDLQCGNVHASQILLSLKITTNWILSLIVIYKSCNAISVSWYPDLVLQNLTAPSRADILLFTAKETICNKCLLVFVFYVGQKSLELWDRDVDSDVGDWGRFLRRKRLGQWGKKLSKTMVLVGIRSQSDPIGSLRAWVASLLLVLVPLSL